MKYSVVESLFSLKNFVLIVSGLGALSGCTDAKITENHRSYYNPSLPEGGISLQFGNVFVNGFLRM